MTNEQSEAAARCTIVIATYNRRDRLSETLRHLTPLGSPIVVVDNGSSDATFEMVRERYPTVEPIRLPSNTGAAGRTQGVLAARTPYIAFCDDDGFWEAGSVPRAVALFDTYPDVALLNARIVLPDGSIDEACELMRVSPIRKRTACPGTAIGLFIAGSCCIRREAYLAAGGFHPRYVIGAEEALLALDLLDRGWELIYADDLISRHEPSAFGRDPERRRKLVMRNRLWTAWLRRSYGGAWEATVALAREGRRNPVARAALREALAGIPWIVRERKRVSPHVESMLDLLTILPA